MKKSILIPAAFAGIGTFSIFVAGIIIFQRKKKQKYVEEEILEESEQKIDTNRDKIFKFVEENDEETSNDSEKVKDDEEEQNYISEYFSENDMTMLHYEDPIDHVPFRTVYLIDENTFRLTNDNYYKTSITFYKDDDILLDEKDEYISFNGGIVDAQEDVVEAMRHAQPGTCIFFRNDIFETDFEVYIDHRNSKDVVGGTYANPDYQKALEYYGIARPEHHEQDDKVGEEDGKKHRQ